MAGVEGGQGGILDQHGNRIDPRNAPGHQGAKAAQYIQERTAMHTQPMIRSQLVAAQAGTTCYIYNVSTIFEWRRIVKGFGTFIIPKAPAVGTNIVDNEGKTRPATEDDIRGIHKVSTAIVINHSFVNSYDKGDTRRIPYVEYGEDIAEGIVGNSKLYPSDLAIPTNNLETWGVFITYGHPFHELPKDIQDDIYTKAMTQHQARCFEKVIKADELFNRAPNCVLEIHRKCALAVGETRPWVTSRTPVKKANMIECPFCTSEIKATALKCPECREVVNQEAYNARLKSAKKPKQDEE